MFYHNSCTILMCFLLFVNFGIAQETEQQRELKRQAKEKKLIEQKKDDVFEELDKKNLTLRFFDALTGKEISGATVSVNGTEFFTDEEGKALFPTPDEDGFLPVSFRASKYVPADFQIEVLAGTLFFNRFSVSPLLDVKFLRVVLDWDSSPADLDAHLVKQGGFHISYRNLRTLDDGSGQLDRDATSGFGPETITLREISGSAGYTFFVQDYTDGTNGSTPNLSRSKATVKVFGDGKLLNVFQVPRNGKGNYWQVFRIANGGVVEVNRLADRIE